METQANSVPPFDMNSCHATITSRGEGTFMTNSKDTNMIINVFRDRRKEREYLYMCTFST